MCVYDGAELKPLKNLDPRAELSESSCKRCINNIGNISHDFKNKLELNRAWSRIAASD